MAFRTTVSLSGWTFVPVGSAGWWLARATSDSTVDTDLTSGTGGLRLTRVVVNFSSGQLQIFLSPDSDTTAQNAGEFSSDFESEGAITYTGPAGSVTVIGTGSDTDEPYIWTPDNAADFATTFGTAPAANTLTSVTFDLVRAVDVEAGTVSLATPSATLSPEADAPTPVEAQLGAVSSAAPGASASAVPDASPVDAEVGALSPLPPTATLQVVAVTATGVDAEAGAVSLAAPTANLRAQRRTPTARAVTMGVVSLAAPGASANAVPDASPVGAEVGALAAPAPSARLAIAADIAASADAAIGALALPAPGASLRGAVSDLFVDARPGRVGVSSPSARLSLQGVALLVDARPGTVSVATPSARLLAVPASLSELYEVAIRAAAPEQRVLTCVELRHPGALSPVRLVNDTKNRIVGGETYVRSRFEAKLADDPERRAPRAQLVVGNVGRDIAQWIELIGGGAGGTARIFEVIDVAGAVPEWEMTLDLASVSTDSAHVVAVLGFDPLLGRPSVALRFDPQTAPGLF